MDPTDGFEFGDQAFVPKVDDTSVEADQRQRRNHTLGKVSSHHTSPHDEQRSESAAQLLHTILPQIEQPTNGIHAYPVSLLVVNSG